MSDDYEDESPVITYGSAYVLSEDNMRAMESGFKKKGLLLVPKSLEEPKNPIGFIWS